MSHFGYKPMQVRLFWLSLLQNKPNIPNSLNRLMASSDGQLCLYFWLSLSLAFLSPKSILNEKKASIGSCSIQIDQSLELSYGATTTTTAAAAATTTTIGGIIINMIIRRSRAATRNRERERDGDESDLVVVVQFLLPPMPIPQPPKPPHLNHLRRLSSFPASCLRFPPNLANRRGESGSSNLFSQFV